MALLQVFLALLASVVTTEVFVSARAIRSTEDICQKYLCNLTYNCNRTFKNGCVTTNATSFTTWEIREVLAVSNSSECKVKQINDTSLPRFSWEHCNSTDDTSGKHLCYSIEHSIIIINQNVSGFIRAKACLREQRGRARQDNICDCSKQDEPRFSDESGRRRQAERHIETTFFFVMLFLLLEILACVILYICVRHNCSQTTTVEIENSSGSSSNEELSQIAHQPPVTNQEPYETLLLTNRNPRMTAQNSYVLEEPDGTKIARQQGLVQNRFFRGNVFDKDHGKGVTGSNEEPLYTVTERPDPSEKESRCPGNSSSSSRTRQNPSDEAQNMAPSPPEPYAVSPYRVVDVPIFVTERSHEEPPSRNTHPQPDRALPGDTCEEPFYHVLENPYDSIEEPSMQDVDDDEIVL